MIDHVIVVTPDLFASQDWLSEQTGVAGTYGGKNPVNGTHNVLIPLGGTAYLELLGADESGREVATRGLPFGLETLEGRMVAGWAAGVEDLDRAVEASRAAGVPLGELVSMSRTRPDGVKLEWRMTYPVDGPLERLCPFLIDWGSSEHPTVALRAASNDCLALLDFEVRSTDPEQVGHWLHVLGLEADVRLVDAAAPGFRVRVRGPKGEAVVEG